MEWWNNGKLGSIAEESLFYFGRILLWMKGGFIPQNSVFHHFNSERTEYNSLLPGCDHEIYRISII